MSIPDIAYKEQILVREENTSEIIGLILLIIILTFVFLYVALYGKTIDNEIDSAIFEVRLNDDGTAEITEAWMRPYGTFERRIDNPEGERFRHLKVLNASDNYWVRRFSDYYIITMYYHSQERKEPYKITYRLTGVFKEIKGDTSQFSFDFLGSEFPDRVGSMDIIIYLPEGTSAARVDTKGKKELSDNAVRISAVSKKGSFPVTVDVYKNDGSHVTDLSYYFIKWKRYVFWGLVFVILMLLFCIIRFGLAAANKDVF